MTSLKWQLAGDEITRRSLAEKAACDLAKKVLHLEDLVERAAELLRLGSSPAWQWNEGRKKWMIDAGEKE